MNAPHHAAMAVPPISRRGESLGTENAFVVLAEVNALVREGRDIVSFCIGQPDFPTPVNVQDAAIAAIRGGRHGYTPSAGIDELRAAAAQDMGALRGLDIRPEDVVVGAGAKPFIAYTIASVTDHGTGDEVIYPVPGFPIYESQIVANGAVAVPIYLRESRNFAFDPAELAAKIGPKTRLVIPRKVSMFCELFGYRKQAYYKQTQFKALSQVKMERAKSLVLQLRRQMPRLGTRKLYYLLRDDFSQDQIKMGRDKLYDFLKSEGLLILRRKKYTITTNSKHWMKKYPNLIKDLTIHRPEQVWAADITFIDTVERGNCYLHLITDAYTKQIMGYELCNNMEASSTLKVLKMAIKSRQYKDQNLIHHSDRGLQYCSKTYTLTLFNNKITISMTET